MTRYLIKITRTHVYEIESEIDDTTCEELEEDVMEYFEFMEMPLPSYNDIEVEVYEIE